MGKVTITFTDAELLATYISLLKYPYRPEVSRLLDLIKSRRAHFNLVQLKDLQRKV